MPYNKFREKKSTFIFSKRKVTHKTKTSFRHTGNQTHHHLTKPASRLHEESKLSKHWGDSEARLWRSTRGVTLGWRNCCRCDKIFAWMSSTTWCHIVAPNSTLGKIIQVQGLFQRKSTYEMQTKSIAIRILAVRVNICR